jgi:thioredoxin-related protein
MTGELSGGELQKLYSKDFVVVDAESPSSYAQDHELRKLTGRSYTPVWVFLDADGTKILENTGFRNPREARALHAYVTGRHYRKVKYEDFLAAYPKS